MRVYCSMPGSDASPLIWTERDLCYNSTASWGLQDSIRSILRSTSTCVVVLNLVRVQQGETRNGAKEGKQNKKKTEVLCTPDDLWNRSSNANMQCSRQAAEVSERNQKRLRTSRMVALQSGQRPRPARTWRAQARQKVWPQGTKAAPLPRATHTQHRPPTPPPFSSSSPSSSGAASSAPARLHAHCCSARSSSASRDTLWLCPRAAAAGAAVAVPPGAGRTAVARREATAGGRRPSSASRMASSSVRRLGAVAGRSSPSLPPTPSSRSLSRSRRLDDAASCSASVMPRSRVGRGTRTSIPRATNSGLEEPADDACWRSNPLPQFIPRATARSGATLVLATGFLLSCSL
uniref:Uncharacterized protein n=1 Tax=Zea mays TaxID=4577 RepID=A0A804MPM2_MAIZE